jgi:hypothetical protein
LETQEIQKILREVLSSAIDELKVKEVEFNYTGDGYFCTFAGDSSSAVLDFINLAIPELLRRFSAYKQDFRAGIDFGFIEPNNDPLSQNDEFFDSPAIYGWDSWPAIFPSPGWDERTVLPSLAGLFI